MAQLSLMPPARRCAGCSAHRRGTRPKLRANQQAAARSCADSGGRELEISQNQPQCRRASRLRRRRRRRRRCCCCRRRRRRARARSSSAEKAEQLHLRAKPLCEGVWVRLHLAHQLRQLHPAHLADLGVVERDLMTARRRSMRSSTPLQLLPCTRQPQHACSLPADSNSRQPPAAMHTPRPQSRPAGTTPPARCRQTAPAPPGCAGASAPAAPPRARRGCPAPPAARAPHRPRSSRLQAAAGAAARQSAASGEHAGAWCVVGHQQQMQARAAATHARACSTHSTAHTWLEVLCDAQVPLARPDALGGRAPLQQQPAGRVKHKHVHRLAARRRRQTRGRCCGGWLLRCAAFAWAGACA